jgi:biotin synthase
LIELSNRCRKDCLYCGIRKSNLSVKRYSLTDEEILNAARFAHDQKLGSVVLQAGENQSFSFVNRIVKIVEKIKNLSQGGLGITLSLGEQSESVYHKWFEAGAHRYLLRIETTNPELYQKIHPKNRNHDFNHRLQSLLSLQNIGYQVGTGVMIGLPFQLTEDLANDLLFFQNFGIDMVGMGPYIEHRETPLYQFKSHLLPLSERFDLTLKMIAVSRIIMKNINIASTTTLQAIDPQGREKGIKAGANIVMPNITPGLYRNDYSPYENKPRIFEKFSSDQNISPVHLSLPDDEIGFGEWGDSPYFKSRKS